jgi:glycosyltransferase involved in cell wall biosynthesis
MPGRIIISVTSDLITDQRVQRAAGTLKEAGYHVLVLGRRLPTSGDLPGKRYRCIRFRLWFNKGPLFYANYNLKLFWFLLWNHADYLLSNDLDTLPANILASRIKRIPLVYDSHEYFTGVPELASRPKVRRIWERIEAFCLPRVRSMYTVNESIANLYRRQYNREVSVIRNFPSTYVLPKRDKTLLRRELGLPTDKHIVILQGAGINIQRGAEEAVSAMNYLENVLLLIVGGGDVLPLLREMVAEQQLCEKVRFVPKQVPGILILYTQSADLGLSLDKDTNINYRFSLPNKLFDYIQARIPVLASRLPEVERIVENYGVGRICPDHNPATIAACISQILDDDAAKKVMAENLERAAAELNWEKERNKLLEIFKNID